MCGPPFSLREVVLKDGLQRHSADVGVQPEKGVNRWRTSGANATVFNTANCAEERFLSIAASSDSECRFQEARASNNPDHAAPLSGSAE